VAGIREKLTLKSRSENTVKGKKKPDEGVKRGGFMEE